LSFSSGTEVGSRKPLFSRGIPTVDLIGAWRFEYPPQDELVVLVFDGEAGILGHGVFEHDARRAVVGSRLARIERAGTHAAKGKDPSASVLWRVGRCGRGHAREIVDLVSVPDARLEADLNKARVSLRAHWWWWFRLFFFLTEAGSR
jgi:hypothetical protein